MPGLALDLSTFSVAVAIAAVALLFRLYLSERVARIREHAARIREHAARIAAENEAEVTAKKCFFKDMRSISSSSAVDTKSSQGEERLDAPTPSGFHDLLCAFPEVNTRDRNVKSAWAAFCEQHSECWRPPPAKLKENRDVHPSIARVLDAVVPLNDLRVWHDKLAPDEIGSAQIRPDFTLTGRRDATPSTIGALLFVEVKLPGQLEDAATQTRTYLRRRVFKLTEEADNRGEALDGIFSYGVATDGARMVLIRVDSGAPPPGRTFKGASPCPVLVTEALPLLDNWNFRTPKRFSPSAVPKGFRALFRICSNPQVLGSTRALERLGVTLTFEGGAPVDETLELGERLGSGGTSDVYACDVDNVNYVLKVARIATAGVASGFSQEQSALRAMQHAGASGLVPVCIASGRRHADGRTRNINTASVASWPVLLLSPPGVPLASWVDSKVVSAVASMGVIDATSAAAAARIECADAVVLRVLDTLKAARDEGLVHCDVRPSNIVVVGDAAMLVDWGVSCSRGARLKSRGVAAFADRRIFDRDGTVAQTSLDVTAALFTWLAIAFGCGCDAPWGTITTPENLFLARTRWLNNICEGTSRPARIAQAVRALEGANARSRADALVSARCAIETGRLRPA